MTSCTMRVVAILSWPCFLLRLVTVSANRSQLVCCGEGVLRTSRIASSSRRVVDVKSAALRAFFSSANTFSNAEGSWFDAASDCASGMSVSTSEVKSASCFFSGADMVACAAEGVMRKR